MKAISVGEEITEAFADLGQNRSKRYKQLADSHYTPCECDKCRLHLDKHIDYEEFGRLSAMNDYHVSLVGNNSMAAQHNTHYRINDRLVQYLHQIYGENDVFNSEKLVLSFMCFAKYSKKSSKSLIKEWYQKIEPTVLITHGSQHPTYKLLQNIYTKFK